MTKKNQKLQKLVEIEKIQNIFFLNQTCNIRIENNPWYVIITSLFNGHQLTSVKIIQVACKFITEKVYTYTYIKLT